MNSHDFYILLDGKTDFPVMKNGIHKYPNDFIDRYNSNRDKLENLVLSVKSAIEEKSALEKEQFSYTVGGGM